MLGITSESNVATCNNTIIQRTILNKFTRFSCSELKANSLRKCNGGEPRRIFLFVLDITIGS